MSIWEKLQQNIGKRKENKPTLKVASYLHTPKEFVDQFTKTAQDIGMSQAEIDSYFTNLDQLIAKKKDAGSTT